MFKSHFNYDKRKRSGILFFAVITSICLAAIILYKPVPKYTVSSEEKERVLAFQAEIDSLKAIELEKRKPKIFPFNPTLLTDFNGYKLGMSIDEIDRVIRFRESGKWFNSSAEFQKVSGVSDSLLAVIEPYFKWPEWLKEQRKNPTTKRKTRIWKTTEEKDDLNTATLNDLLVIDGVNQVDAEKVLAHRDKIKGYQIDYQIHTVYGVPKDVKRLILNHFTVKAKPEIIAINVNKATASDLSTVPLLDFDLAKEIVDYRLLREGIISLEELKDLDGMTDFKYGIIKLYLHID